jgi:hypothetical protein
MNAHTPHSPFCDCDECWFENTKPDPSWDQFAVSEHDIDDHLASVRKVAELAEALEAHLLRFRTILETKEASE